MTIFPPVLAVLGTMHAETRNATVYAVSRPAGWPKLNLLQRSIMIRGSTNRIRPRCSKWMSGRVINVDPKREEKGRVAAGRSREATGNPSMGRLREISVFPLTKLIMDVPIFLLYGLFGILTCNRSQAFENEVNAFVNKKRAH